MGTRDLHAATSLTISREGHGSKSLAIPALPRMGTRDMLEQIACPFPVRVRDESSMIPTLPRMGTRDMQVADGLPIPREDNGSKYSGPAVPRMGARDIPQMARPFP